jgi:hypothetical protein
MIIIVLHLTLEKHFQQDTAHLLRLCGLKYNIALSVACGMTIGLPKSIKNNETVLNRFVDYFIKRDNKIVSLIMDKCIQVSMVL